MLALAACGGAPFEAGLLGAPDAGDAGAAETAEPDTGAVEAGAVDSGAPDSGDAGDAGAAPDAEAGHDAAPTCTPLPAIGTYSCAEQARYTACNPSDFCAYDTGPAVGSPWGECHTIPAACRCAETYTCACVLAQFGPAVCPAGTVYASCAVVNGNVQVQCD
jgi:hypothetical protein